MLLRISKFVVLVVSMMVQLGWISSSGWANLVKSHQYIPQFPPCSPVSEPAPDRLQLEKLGRGEEEVQAAPPNLDFCSRWNPEFVFNGHHCCAKTARTSRKRRRLKCSTQRIRGNYCGEITQEQQDYARLASSGQLGDILQRIEQDLGQKGNQAYCTVNNGFLAWGRRLIPSEVNRIALCSPDRCTNFGTDSMVGMLEWVGRQVAQTYRSSDYQKTHLVVGDISAPRGGCLAGRGGRVGHLSHTTGQDVDISFLVAKSGRASPVQFHRDFDAKQNWNFLKQVFKNPFACVKVVFLDQKLIRKLSSVAHQEEEWSRYQRFIRHMPGHKNHFHIRVGEGPGLPGCVPNAQPELELEEDGDGLDLDFLEEDEFVSRPPLLLHATTTTAQETSASISRSPSEVLKVKE